MIKIFFIFSFISLSHAEVIRMVQADKTFLGNITDKEATAAFDDPGFEEKHKVETLTTKVGDSILFVNRDEVSHNVSGWEGETNLFDVKIQAPGTSNDRTILLKKKGEYIIQCAIHPKMKIKLKVE
jgi:plastocyanin